MARAVRAVTTERGRDVRTYILVAFGGSGPLHAASLARQFDIPKVVVPPFPGLFSAFGLLFADVARHIVRTVPGSKVPLSAAVLAQFPELERDALGCEPDAGVGADGSLVEWFADLRYRGQGHELRIAIHSGDSTDVVASRFAAEHRSLFGHDKPGVPIEVVNLRLIVRTRNRWVGLQPHMVQPEERSSARVAGWRKCYFGPGLGSLSTRIVPSRSDIGAKATDGPLVVEEYDATIVVPPDFSVSRDAFNNLWLERGR
jgi:N-methylhydantoinase A